MKIHLEFAGGPHDGLVTAGVLGDGSDTERCYRFTEDGTVGHCFTVVSEYVVDLLQQMEPESVPEQELPAHVYVISERMEEDDEVHLKVEHRGHLAKSSS